MKINKILIISLLLLTIILLILSFKTQKNIINNKKVEIPKIVIPKVTAPEIATHKEEETEEDELSKVVSGLQAIIEEDESHIEQDNLTDDEIQNILSNLKSLELIGEEKTIVIKKPKVPVTKVVAEKRVSKKVIAKKVIAKKNIAKKRVSKEIISKKRDIIKKRQIVKYTKPKETIIYKEVIIKKPSTVDESTITEEEYRRKLAKESEVAEEIASLSMVDTVDMNIEQRIKKGEVKELTTSKPIVEQKTIYIPSNDKKIEENIPWAKLREVNEKVDGIFIEEHIN